MYTHFNYIVQQPFGLLGDRKKIKIIAKICKRIELHCYAVVKIKDFILSTLT